MWMHRLVGKLEANEGLELVLVLGEIFRRHQWVHIRVEAELHQGCNVRAPFDGCRQGHLEGLNSEKLGMDEGEEVKLAAGS
jgi:hypothetical protein